MADDQAAREAGKVVDPARQKIARALAKILWDRDFRKENPGADAAAKRESWNASKAEYVRAGRSLHVKMEKAGLTVTGPAE